MKNNLSQQQYLLKSTIEVYNNNFSTCLEKFLNSYRNLSSKELYKIISHGKYKSIDSKGKMVEKTCSHLKHIRKEVYPKVEVLLNTNGSEINTIANSNSNFDELYTLLQPIGQIEYAGPQMLFDTTLHLAYALNIPAGKILYLHSGALRGFKKMFPNLKLDYKYGISINKLPHELQVLGAYHCENFFCLYFKGCLSNLKLKNSCMGKGIIKYKNLNNICVNI